MRRLALAGLILAACAHGPATRPTTSQGDALLDRYPRIITTGEHGDLEAAEEGWLALVGEAAGAREPALATVAARHLQLLAGEVPNERGRKLRERLAGVELRRLPLDARRYLLAARALHARRAGDEHEARQLDRLGGCPDAWRAAGPFGHLPRLDLETPFAPESNARAESRDVPTRGCQVVLEGSHARPGVMYAGNWFRAPRALEAMLTVESELPWRLYVDGQLSFSAVEADRYPPRARQVALALAAGWHHVVIKLAAPGGRAEASISLLPEDGNATLEVFTGATNDAPATAKAPGPGREQVIAEDTSSPQRRLLTVEQALARGDIMAAEHVLGEAPHVAEEALLAAQAALDDPSRPAQLAQDRARRFLEQALALDPQLVRARYLRALLSLNADRPREALSRLADAPKPDKPYWRFAFLKYQALKARGWLREAEEALDEARRLHPDGCSPLDAEIALRRERHDVRGALKLAKEEVTCAGGSDDYADALREMGDLDGAIAEYRRLVALDPARESFASGLAETLEQKGESKEAAVLFARLAERYPRATTYRRQLADARVALGDLAGARRALEDGLAAVPESQDLHRALEALCESAAKPSESGCHIMDPFRVDGRQVIAAYEKSRPSYASPAVIVLDRTVTRVFPTGARLTLTHNIIQVLAKDGIDKWGEVQIPEGADVLTLRAIKADGSTREPEAIAEKETVSVPDLEPGDYVEFEYVDPAPPPGAFPGGFIAERFFFRSFDAPLDRTEYLLVTPERMPVQIDARAGAPDSTVEKKDGLAWRLWAGRKKPQAFQEPSSTPFAEDLPSVRAASGVSLDGWKDYLRDGELFSSRKNAELERVAERETAGKKTVEEKIAAIDQWVRRHIRGGGQLDEAATAILARGEGNRVTLEQALLRAAGVPSEIWLARPETAQRLDGALPDLEAFDQPLLRVTAPGHARTLDPRYRHSPTGFIVPVLRGAQALPIASAAAKLTAVEAGNPDDRQMDFEAKLDREGAAEVRVRERLTGWPALEWREALEKLDPDRVRPEFEQRTLGYYFPGSTLEDLKVSGADDDDGAFTVEYRFRAPQLARRIGQRLLIPAPYPAMLGRRYVGVAARKTPLAIDYAAPTSVDARYTLPPGVAVELPPPVKATGFGEFEQVATRTPDGFQLKARFAMPRVRVPAARYGEVVEFATRVDRAEARAAELLLK